MTTEFETQKAQFISMTNKAFADCAATGVVLDPLIKIAIDIALSKRMNCIEGMKYVLSSSFSNPQSVEDGSTCSELFMGVIEAFPTND